MLLWGATLKTRMYSSKVMSELCDLVNHWLFTVKCFVFKWPWPWWDYCKWSGCVAGEVTESVESIKYLCDFKSEKYSSLTVETFDPKKRNLLSSLFHLFALCSLFTVFGFKISVHRHLCYSLWAKRVLLWAPRLCFCHHCLLMLLNADTILHWFDSLTVWQSVQHSKIHDKENPQENGLHNKNI